MYNFGYILEGTSPVILPLVIALILMIVPIGVLLIIAVVKFIIKNAKRNHKSVESDEDIKNKYLALFGEENIISISSNMNRVTGNKTKTSSIDLSSIQQSKLNIDFKNLSNLSSKINTKVLKTFSQINVNIFKKKLS